jgi:hypothetical protein
MREKRTAYRLLVGKPEGKRPLGRQRSKWVDNIKMDLKELYILPTECVVVFHMVLTINSEFFHKQH